MESANEKTLFEVSEIQLLYKSEVKASLRPKISRSKDAEEYKQYVGEYSNLPQAKIVRKAYTYIPIVYKRLPDRQEIY